MLSHYKDSMESYVWRIPHGSFSVETRKVVRNVNLRKYAKIPVLRFLIAIFFILKDDAYIRPRKPDPNKPMFYRYFIWKVHNCGRRKDGTMYTSGAAALMIFYNSELIYNSNTDDVPFHELKSRFGTHG